MDITLGEIMYGLSGRQKAMLREIRLDGGRLVLVPWLIGAHRGEHAALGTLIADEILVEVFVNDVERPYVMEYSVWLLLHKPKRVTVSERDRGVSIRGSKKPLYITQNRSYYALSDILGDELHVEIIE